MTEKWQTRHTLLQRAQDKNDQTAWEEFAHYYSPFIYMVLNKMGYAHSEHDDLVQRVLLKLWQGLENYNKDRSKFRTWLGSIIRNTVYKHYEQTSRRNRRHEVVANEQEVSDYIHTVSESEIDTMIEEEWKTYISMLAFENLKSVFSGKAIDVFKLTIQDVPIDEISERLEVTKQSIYVLRNRIKPRFVSEIRKLIHELEL